MPDIFISSNNPKTSGSDNKKPHWETLPPLTPEAKRQLEKEKIGQSINIPKGTDKHKLPGHSHNPLAAYSFYPDNIKFISADSQEKIVLLLRRHPLTNLPWIIITFFMIIAPFFAMIIPFYDVVPGEIRTVAMIVWYMITSAFVLEEFLGWFFNVNIVTDERIFDVDFLSLMYRDISEADLDQIQDVTVEVGGTFRTFFGYGNVLIQTAAQVPRIEFGSVPHPDKVAKVLRELGVDEEIEKIEGRIR